MKHFDFFRKTPTSVWEECMAFSDKYYCIVCSNGKTKVYDNATDNPIANITGVKNIVRAEFISDNEILVKGNLGNYFIYDIIKKMFIWEYHSKPLDTFYNDLIVNGNELLDRSFSYAKNTPFKGLPFFLNYRTNEVNLLKNYREPTFGKKIPNKWDSTLGTLLKSSYERHAFLVDDNTIYDIDFNTHSANVIFGHKDFKDSNHVKYYLIICDSLCNNIVAVKLSDADNESMDVIVYNRHSHEEFIVDSYHNQRFDGSYACSSYQMHFDKSGRYLAVTSSKINKKEGGSFLDFDSDGYVRIIDTVLKKEIYCNYGTDEKFGYIDGVQWHGNTLYMFTEKMIYHMTMG